MADNYANVSVIIPCYRSADTVQRAVESVAKQTLVPVEVILVEDCSGDETLQKLYHLQTLYADGWIKVIPLTINDGPGTARNVGWEVAKEPYITFLDADDTWHPEKLRIQYEFIRNNPDVALCGHQCIWLRDSAPPPVLPKDLQETKISARSLLFKNAFSTPTVMLRRDIPFRFQESKRFAEDLLLWQHIAFAGLLVVRIESPLAYVHKSLYGEDGLSAQLWKMEIGELRNLIELNRQNKINHILFIAATGFSMAKYYKRLLKICLKQILYLLRYDK
ncbi:MAG: glycosyltransferase family 2 protein [Methylobacter sp.]|nr:glycosyltransferase family 2 protein [Methylobacter sp.]